MKQSKFNESVLLICDKLLNLIPSLEGDSSSRTRRHLRDDIEELRQCLPTKEEV